MNTQEITEVLSSQETPVYDSQETQSSAPLSDPQESQSPTPFYDSQKTQSPVHRSELVLTPSPQTPEYTKVNVSPSFAQHQEVFEIIADSDTDAKKIWNEIFSLWFKRTVTLFEWELTGEELKKQLAKNEIKGNNNNFTAPQKKEFIIGVFSNNLSNAIECMRKSLTSCGLRNVKVLLENNNKLFQSAFEEVTDKKMVERELLNEKVEKELKKRGVNKSIQNLKNMKRKITESREEGTKKRKLERATETLSCSPKELRKRIKDRAWQEKLKKLEERQGKVYLTEETDTEDDDDEEAFSNSGLIL